MKDFLGYHSEWNMGSPGGWDYQRTTQMIAKTIWNKLNKITKINIDLDFDHPLLNPVSGFADMLVNAHRNKEGSNNGTIAIVAEQETLEDVTENINLANRLNTIDGIKGILAAPHEFELKNSKVCYKGEPVSIFFLDFNNDILLKLHRKHNLKALIQAVKENRTLNPRGTEPINVKSMFEVITQDKYENRFHPEIVFRTPWTRRFFGRKTTGPDNENIADLISWTKDNWANLVLKPERGYSGIGVEVGDENKNADNIIKTAIEHGSYIVQKKIPLALWTEEIPEPNFKTCNIVIKQYQTDFRCMMGLNKVFGFLGRYGGVPTNVGSGGGVQPLGVLRSPISVKEAVKRLNNALLEMKFENLAELSDMQDKMALKEKFTYLLGPIKIALRPRIIAPEQLIALQNYCKAMWQDCLVLEKMWENDELNDYISIEEEELKIARMQPWNGSPALFASDGLFSFGSHPEKIKRTKKSKKR